ncbi:hypothetical protein DFH09DRAFT_1315151 [Mycena vulgaris]|nr:hypothetical protein DFH09DRAFT_1315151 [Mycena vulgaris]
MSQKRKAQHFATRHQSCGGSLILCHDDEEPPRPDLIVPDGTILAYAMVRAADAEERAIYEKLDYSSRTSRCSWAHSPTLASIHGIDPGARTVIPVADLGPKLARPPRLDVRVRHASVARRRNPRTRANAEAAPRRETRDGNIYFRASPPAFGRGHSLGGDTHSRHCGSHGRHARANVALATASARQMARRLQGVRRAGRVYRVESQARRACPARAGAECTRRSERYPRTRNPLRNVLRATRTLRPEFDSVSRDADATTAGDDGGGTSARTWRLSSGLHSDPHATGIS